MARLVDSHFLSYLKEIRQTDLLTADEEKSLARKLREGDKDARERMIKANLRLVVSVAKDFLNRGLPYMDLINEGNIGLMRAVEKFDPDAGNRFSTYGIHWIKQAIRRALANTGKTVRVPSYMIELVSHFRHKSQEMQNRSGGRPPDIRDVAREMNVSDDQLDMVRRAMNAATLSTDIRSEEGGVSLTDILADPRSPNPADEVSFKSEVEMLGDMLQSITDREARILRMRFGIGTNRPMTLSEIGEIENLTRERIRQIENEALRSLQSTLSRRGGYDDEF